MNQFLVVTFAWSLAFAAFVIWRLFRCRHDWEPVVERELPSKAEELAKQGENIKDWEDTDDLKAIASKTFFALISCKKCGAVKKYEVRT